MAYTYIQQTLDITGCIITLDAMGTQKYIAAQIHGEQADYILSLKAKALLGFVYKW